MNLNTETGKPPVVLHTSKNNTLKSIKTLIGGALIKMFDSQQISTYNKMKPLKTIHKSMSSSKAIGENPIKSSHITRVSFTNNTPFTTALETAFVAADKHYGKATTACENDNTRYTIERTFENNQTDRNV